MHAVPRHPRSIRNTLAVLAVVLALAPRARADSVAIVVAKTVPVENVSSDELAKIFRCEEPTGPGGVKWEIFSRERSAREREVVLKVVYHMTDAQYNRFFMQAVFAGKMAEAPRVIPSGTAMRAIAATRPGAVTYILASQVDDSVKVLKVDGLLPGAPGYPLALAD
jgi:hypothetical protein